MLLKEDFDDWLCIANGELQIFGAKRDTRGVSNCTRPYLIAGI
jgi:hypothetical protein